MKTFYIIFKVPVSLPDYMLENKSKTEKFYRIEHRARTFAEAERKFNKQTSNEFGKISFRIIHEIKLKTK